MSRDLLSVSIVIFVILLPLVTCDTIKSDQNPLEEKISEMDQLMMTMTEDVDKAEIAPGRNVAAAKKSAEEYSPVKKGLVQTVVKNDIEEKIDEMNQLMKAVIDEVPLAKNAPGRNIKAAKKSAEEYAAVKKEFEKKGKFRGW